MIKVALVLEGRGDVSAAPSLVAKIATLGGLQKFASEPPIRAGEARKLRRAGELERYLELAATRPDAQSILLLVDLDDDCPVDFARDFRERAKVIEERFHKPVSICFAVREFEGWFLDSIASIRAGLPEYGIEAGVVFHGAELVRAAKESLSAVCKLKRYKQTRDQCLFAKNVDVKTLYRNNRSFRHFVKEVLASSYEQIDRDWAPALTPAAD